MLDIKRRTDSHGLWRQEPLPVETFFKGEQVDSCSDPVGPLLWGQLLLFLAPRDTSGFLQHGQLNHSVGRGLQIAARYISPTLGGRSQGLPVLPRVAVPRDRRR